MQRSLGTGQSAPRLNSANRITTRNAYLIRRGATNVDEPATSSQTAAAAAAAAVHDGRLPFLQQLLQFSSPQQYSKVVMQGHKFAWGRTSLPPTDTLFVADIPTLRSWLSSEAQLGIQTKWPETFRVLLGDHSIAMTKDPQLHARLRQIIGPYFSAEAVQDMMPGIHETVRNHLSSWAAAGAPVGGYTGSKLLTFDVIVNQALGMQMSEEEVQKYSQIFQVWTDGFMPPAINLPIFPFGRGIKAREQLKQRALQALASPNLPPAGLLARFVQEWGAESEVSWSNLVNLLFAGHDTTSSAITYLMWLLVQHPDVVQQLRAEQATVLQQHGPVLTPAAIADMSYTTAVARETLRLTQIVAYAPRVPTQALTAQSAGPTIPSGCPFLIALSVISAADPSVAQDGQQFKPERWLDPVSVKSLQQYQLPFGIGQRYCLGSNLAMAELTAVLAELSRSWQLSADSDTEWVDFPIKRPTNGLPIKLVPLAAAAS